MCLHIGGTSTYLYGDNYCECVPWWYTLGIKPAHIEQVIVVRAGITKACTVGANGFIFVGECFIIHCVRIAFVIACAHSGRIASMKVAFVDIARAWGTGGDRVQDNHTAFVGGDEHVVLMRIEGIQQFAGDQYGNIFLYFIINLFSCSVGFIASANDQYCSYWSLGEGTNEAPVNRALLFAMCQSIQIPFLPPDYSGVSPSLVRSCHRGTSPVRWYHNLADHLIFMFRSGLVQFQTTKLIIACCVQIYYVQTDGFVSKTCQK